MNAANEVRSVQDLVKNRAAFYKETDKNVRRYAVEFQKKFTFVGDACIALFLIGAPLGAIIRKGGLGMSGGGVGHILHYILYHIHYRRKISKRWRCVTLS